MHILKQSTTVTVQLGPFLDEDDGKTTETGLTISQADVRLSKNGAAFAQANDSNAATHDENGWYRKQLDTTDTGTLGRLIVAVHESGALPVWREFVVVPANAFDSLVAGSDLLSADVRAVNNNETVDYNLETWLANSIGSDSKTLISTDAQDLSGSLDVNVASVAANAIDNDAFAADAISAPKFATGALGADALSATAVNEIVDAVWDELLSGHTDAGSTGEALGNVQTLGAGAITFTYTLTSSVDASPIGSATVWVTTDEAGTNVVASGTTNTSGQVVFYLDAGTYYVWREKAGFNFTNPDTETVA